jgi:hypothetical protein
LFEIIVSQQRQTVCHACATAWPPVPARALKFPHDRQWIACETGHLDLLSRRDVYERMAGWVAQK